MSSTTYATSALPKRALLIGANYDKIPSSTLQGCIDDIVSIRNVLIDAYGYPPENIVMLRDDDVTKMPTRQNILNALNTIAIQSASCSEIWVHYSGHGTQVKDANGDETDGFDEALVPCDYPTVGFISDDVLFDIFKSFKCRVLFFSDSCHSGSIVDLQYSMNYINGAFSKSTSSKKVISNPNIIVMSGCRDIQTSADTYSSVDSQYCGAFTNALTTMLRKNNHTVDIMKVYGDVCGYLVNNGYSQIPVLSSTVAAPTYNFTRAGSPVQVIVQVPSAATTVKPPAATASVKPPAAPTVKPPSNLVPIKISTMPLTITQVGSTTVYTTQPPKRDIQIVPSKKVVIKKNMNSVLLSTVRL